MATSPQFPTNYQDIFANELNIVSYVNHVHWNSDNNYSIASATWTSLANIGFDVYKRYPESNVQVHVSMQVSTSVAADQVEAGVTFDNLASNPIICARLRQNVINTYAPLAGMAVGLGDVSGLSGALYAQLVWRRQSGTGTTIVSAAGIPIMVKVREYVINN